MTKSSHNVIFIGDTSTGKTSIISQFIFNSTDDNIQPTVGIDFFTKEVNNVKLQVWDTAGQEKFHSVLPSYLRKSTVIIMVYDITNKNSFNHLAYWYKAVNEFEPRPIIIVGNKCDLEAERAVETEEGNKFAKDHSATFFETSAKTPIGIDDLFESISQIPTSMDPQEQNDGPKTVILTSPNDNEKTSNNETSVTNGNSCC